MYRTGNLASSPQHVRSSTHYSRQTTRLKILPFCYSTGLVKRRNCFRRHRWIAVSVWINFILSCIESLPRRPVVQSVGAGAERKHGASLPPQKPVRLIRDGEAGGSGIFISNTYSFSRHHRNDFTLGRAVVELFECFINGVGKVTRQCP